MQRYTRRWPWWSPVRWLPAVVIFGGLLVLGVIAARDALARGLQWYLAVYAAGIVVATFAQAIGPSRSGLGPLVFGLGAIVAAVSLVGLFESGLIWQGFVAFLVLIISISAPLTFRMLWPMRTMTDDEKQAYLAQLRAWRRANPPRSPMLRFIRRMRQR